MFDRAAWQGLPWKARYCRQAALLAAAAALVACSTPARGPGSGHTAAKPGAAQSAASHQCSGSSTGVVGALRNAAAIVGCQFTKTYRALQTQSQAQVEQSYKKTNNGQLPNEPTLTAFTTRISPRAQVRRKEELGVASSLTVVPGKTAGPVKIEHEISVVDQYGVEWFKGRKQPNDSGQAGTYSTSFQVEVPSEMEAGTYAVVQGLYINGKPASSNLLRKQSFRVLAQDEAPAASMVATN
jgi:hypothetical protein